SGPSFGEMTPGTQVILASTEHPLVLGPLLPPSHARYLFIRGLPAEAALSAGRQSSSGAWFVKDEEVQDLALSIGEAAKGDYPVDIYTLESGDAPSAKSCAACRSRTGAELSAGADHGLGFSSPRPDAEPWRRGRSRRAGGFDGVAE